MEAMAAESAPLPGGSGSGTTGADVVGVASAAAAAGGGEALPSTGKEPPPAEAACPLAGSLFLPGLPLT
jgi:hypothetical protein